MRELKISKDIRKELGLHLPLYPSSREFLVFKKKMARLQKFQRFLEFLFPQNVE